MIKKLLYTIFSLIKIVFQLKNPLVLFGYLIKKPVRLDFKNGMSLSTNQLLDAVIVKETILDDDYRLSLIKVMKSIIDVGAGLGDFSLLAAKKFPQAQILAFEPNPDQYKLLKENIRINNIKNIKTFNFALGTKKNYHLYLSAFNVHASTLKNDKSKNRIKVTGKRLNEFINESIDLLKLDCEGAELDILKSISNNKMGLIKRIIIEYHNNIIQNEDKKILTILKKWPYKIIIKKNFLVSGTGYIFATSK